jgi:hypothetical protein
VNRPNYTTDTPDTTQDQTAAVIAAIEQFKRDTTTTKDTDQQTGNPLTSPWKRAALDEGVTRQPNPSRASRAIARSLAPRLSDPAVTVPGL